MEKRILAVLVLLFAASTTFAQTPADSSKTEEKLELGPRLKLKNKPGDSAFKFRLPNQNSPEILKKYGEAKEEETPIYSNMPMAKYTNKREDIPNHKADESATKYHLLKKRYKVLPLPTEPEVPAQGGE
ncbi:hypothetical protein [Rufibacter hautae]|uniref:Uncharacterized protein n=1 Tax=Rufibacter hautae TaxID=2595005 RepID=A0A5B6TH30_9BACT|nr:hypothetical protein [Rufibacter hautae]KAA3439316.1 hypothetical protein FOA19_01125 [Rufibacter hautae]